MIVWGLEDEPVPETDFTASAPNGPVVYWLGRDGVYQWDGRTARNMSEPDRPSGWRTAWQIVGWMLIAGALGATIGVWLVLTIYLDS